MTDHARQTIKLWDSMAKPTDASTNLLGTDNKLEPTPQYVKNPHELPDLCEDCESFRDQDGLCECDISGPYEYGTDS